MANQNTFATNNISMLLYFPKRRRSLWCAGVMMYSPITARIIFHGDFTTGDWELNPSAQLATLNLNSFVRLGFGLLHQDPRHCLNAKSTRLI